MHNTFLVYFWLACVHIQVTNQTGIFSVATVRLKPTAISIMVLSDISGEVAHIAMI